MSEHRPFRAARWLIERAARGAPAPLAQRLEEEWLADLAARPSAVSRVRFAVGCCWATAVIAYEHRLARLAVAKPAHGAFPLVDPQSGSGFSSRRSTTLLVVIGLHVALFYGLMTGLPTKFYKIIPVPLQNRILAPAPAPRPELPKLPDLPRSSFAVKLTPPEFPPIQPDYTREAVTPAQDPPPPSAAWGRTPVSAHEVRLVAGGPDKGFPNADDYYPSAAKRLGQQGVSTVRVCVDPHGRLTGEPAIVQPSGTIRLDEAALQLAKAGSGHYRASTEDGRPVNACYAFRVRFELKN